MRWRAGEACIMNAVQHVASVANKPVYVLHLTRREGEIGLLPDDAGKLTERLMEEVNLRATIVGPVLERILNETQGQPRWGLNE